MERSSTVCKGEYEIDVTARVEFENWLEGLLILELLQIPRAHTRKDSRLPAYIGRDMNLFLCQAINLFYCCCIVSCSDL